MTDNRRQRTDKKNGHGLLSVFCLLLSVVCLPACGFHPLYGSRDDNSSVSAELNDVAIENIPDRNGQILRNDLIDRMYSKGRPQNPKYSLTAGLRTLEEGIGLLPDATTSLTELNLYADYTLKDQTGKVVVKATAHATATFNQLQEEYGTLAAEQNAYQRCLDEVSEQIVGRISLYFSEGTTIAPAPPKTEVPIPGLTPGISR